MDSNNTTKILDQLNLTHSQIEVQNKSQATIEIADMHFFDQQTELNKRKEAMSVAGQKSGQQRFFDPSSHDHFEESHVGEQALAKAIVNDLEEPATPGLQRGVDFS